MIKKPQIRPFAIFFGIILMIHLAGCVIIINKPSPQEQELLAIQQTVQQTVSTISQKVSAGNSSAPEIEDYIAQAENTVNQALQRISELDIPNKTKKFAEDTIKYLRNAKAIFQQIRELLANIENLKQKSGDLTNQAASTLKEQIDNLNTNIQVFSGQLSRVAKQIESARKKIMELYQQNK